METIIKADIFFFITSIAVILLTIFTGFFLFYLVGAVKSFRKLLDTLEANVASAGEQVQELMEDIRESFIFSWLFRKKRKKKLADEEK